MSLRTLVTRRALLRAGRILGAVLLVYTVAGFFLIPPLVRSVAASKLTELLHRQARVDRVSLNPYNLTLTIGGFELRDRDGGPFVSWDELRVDLQAASIFRGGVILREVVLRKPAITIVRETADRYSFSDLIDQFSGGPPPDPNAKPARYSINNIRVVGGSFDFVDKPKKATHTIRDLEIAVPFVSNLPYDVESFVQPSLSAVVNGTPFRLDGRTKPFSETRASSFDVNLSDISVPAYMEYVPVQLGFTLPSATLDLHLALSFEQPPDGKAPELSLSGDLAVKGLALRDLANQAVLDLPRLDVAIGRSSLLGGQLAIDKVVLQKPDLHVTRGADGAVNLASLGPRPAAAEPGASAAPPPSASAAPPAPSASASAAAPAAPGPSATAFVLEVAEVRLTDGTVHFRDAAPGGAFETTLSPLNVEVHHFSTAPGKPAEIDVRLQTEAGESIKDSTTLTLSPLRVKTHAELAGVVLRKYAPYYAPSVLIDIDDGKLDLSATVDLDLSGKGPLVGVSDVNAALTALRVHKSGARDELAHLDSLQVKGASLDLGKRAVALGDITLSQGFVAVDRSHEGTINLTTLVPPAPPGKRAARPTPATPSPPWSVQLDRLSLDNCSLRFADRVPDKPVVLTAARVAATIDHFSLARGSRFNLGLRALVGRGGSVAVNGSAVLDPFQASLKVDARSLDLLAAQPYFTDKVNLLLTNGVASAGGDLTIATGQAKPKVTFKGHLGVDKLAAVDKRTSEDFLKWDALYVAGVDFATDPAALAIGEVSLSQFYSRLAVNADATLNLHEIVVSPSEGGSAPASDATAGSQSVADAGATAVASVASPDAGAAPVAASERPMPVRIDKVTLQGGTVDFTDKLVKPNFATSLREVGGRLSGLSTDEGSTADLDLKAKLEDIAPLEISGKVNPLSKELAVDIKVAFHDIDVSPLSPYSGKYVGYTISKGKLFLDLQYTIAKRQLQASNTLFVDQLTLGDRVDSPTATKLPVRLALALLTDRKGEIHIDLPMHGSLDDPKFSVGHIILETLENLVMKAVTAPFALLGSLFGKGEDLSSIEFDAGRATLGPTGAAKLQTLVKALSDRPGLRMDISGYIDAARDAEGLRKVRFERKLKAEKLKELSGQGVAVEASVDDLTLEPQEYARFLELAYKHESFPKPRNMFGIARDLPGPEMEKLMLTHLTVADDDLRTLAQQRADDVRDRLTKAGIAGERLFVVEGKGLAAQHKEGLASSRVDFVLK